MTQHPAEARRQQRKRDAFRAAFKGDQLSLDQVKICLVEIDRITDKTVALTNESCAVADRAHAIMTDRAYDGADRRLTALSRQADELSARLKKFTKHPQIRLALFAREKEESRR